MHSRAQVLHLGVVFSGPARVREAPVPCAPRICTPAQMWDALTECSKPKRKHLALQVHQLHRLPQTQITLAKTFVSTWNNSRTAHPDVSRLPRCRCAFRPRLALEFGASLPCPVVVPGMPVWGPHTSLEQASSDLKRRYQVLNTFQNLHTPLPSTGSPPEFSSPI